MSDEALLLESDAESHAPQASGWALRQVLLWLSLVVFVTAWLGVSIVATRNPLYWLTDPMALSHVIMDFAAMLLAASYGARARGPLPYKISRGLLGAAFIFGLYAMPILAARLFFSRALLSSSAAGGALACVGFVWLRHQLTGYRVALITPLLGDTSEPLPPGRVVSAPDTDLRGFDVALVSLNQTVSADWAKALSRAMLGGCKVRHLGEYVEERRGAVSLEHFEINHVRAHGLSAYRPVKRAMELALSVALLPLILPLVAFGMLATALSSRGPVFFIQERVGLGGKSFRIVKLRTMRIQSQDEPLRAAVKGDARITPVGRLLRRSRIDELPQIWNVLKGDMSLIGPRPEAVALHHLYLAQIPHYSYRYLVRPGITGWAQVNTTPSATVEQAQRKLGYDLFYVKHLSLAVDLQIVARTVWAIINGAGVH